MEGVTNAAVREVLAGYGPVGLVCTEFVRISGEQISPPYLRRQVEKLPGVPLSVQVMGNDPELLAEAGAVVARAGADVVDLNLGCPTHNAARKGVGAALLKQPDKLALLLKTMRRSVPGLLSAWSRARGSTTWRCTRGGASITLAGWPIGASSRCCGESSAFRSSATATPGTRNPPCACWKRPAAMPSCWGVRRYATRGSSAS